MKNVVQQAVCQVPVVVAPGLASTSAFSHVAQRKGQAAIKSNDEEDDNDDDEQNIVPKNLERPVTITNFYNMHQRIWFCLHLLEEWIC